MHPKHKTPLLADSADADARPFTATGRTLPRAIVNARAASRHPLNCLDLSKGARRVLHAILAFYNLRTREAIFPSRRALALEADDMAESTLRRHIAFLEEKEYIARLPQRHRPRTAGADSGKFSVVPIKLTQKGLLMVGLDKVFHKEPSTDLSDGVYMKERTKKEQSSSKNTVPSGTAKEGRPNQYDRDTKLPTDLLPLLDRGMTPPQLFKLMRKATLARKRLSSIYAVRAARIEELNLVGNDAYAYLSQLIDQDIDYDYLAKAVVAEHKVAEADNEAKAMLQRLDGRYDGYEVHRENAVVGILRVPSNASGAAWIESERGSIPLNLNTARQLLRGRCAFIRPEWMAEH